MRQVTEARPNTANEIIRRIINASGLKHETLAKALGIAGRNNFAARLNQKNMTFDTAIKILDVLGYEVVIEPKTSGKRREGSVVVELSDKAVAE